MGCNPKQLVESLVVYNDNSKGVYRGIHKEYFPKWIGWGLIEKGMSKEVIDKEVFNFYEAFFFYQMKLDLLENSAVACAIMNFATLHGKKKAIQKIQKVVSTEATGMELIELFNHCGKCAEYHLLLEFVEFYSFTGDINKIDWLTRAYRCL